MSDKIKLLHKATTALWLELPAQVARDFTDIQQAAIEELEARVVALEGALKPFAQFNDALKEWRFGPSGYVLQYARPENEPFLRWREPTPPPGVPGKLKVEVRMLEVWPQDFARAEEALAATKQEGE